MPLDLVLLTMLPNRLCKTADVLGYCGAHFLALRDIHNPVKVPKDSQQTQHCHCLQPTTIGTA